MVALVALTTAEIVLGAAALCSAQSTTGSPQVAPQGVWKGASLPPFRPTEAQIASYRGAQGGGRGRGAAGSANMGAYVLTIEPHWFANNTKMWYRNDYSDDVKHFVLVDAERGTRTPAFNHAKLAAALSEAAGTDFLENHLPFDEIDFNADATKLSFTAAGGRWSCDLASYQVTRTGDAPRGEGERGGARGLRGRGRGAGGGFGRGQRVGEEITPETTNEGTNLAYDPQSSREAGVRGIQMDLYEDAASPDGKWTASIKDYNIVLRGPGGSETKISDAGEKGDSFGRMSWSPDSKYLVASRIVKAEPKNVLLMRSRPPGEGRTELISTPYPLPGDPYTTYELWVFDAAAKKVVKVDAEKIDFYGDPAIRWRADNQHFVYHKTDRGHGRFRIFDVDARTGKVRTLFDDRPKTFVSTTYNSFIYYTKGNAEVIYACERDGWKHLYLINAESGDVKQITKGEWIVRDVDRVDEDKRQIWFRAGGLYPDQDPYLVHFCHVNFDGTGMTKLTEGNGTHTVQYSPDRKFIVDTYSRVDLPPVHELRRVEDGKLVTRLDSADITELESNGLKLPEVFVAKGRDGKTDIWGVIERPNDLDPTKRYPVIEYIYAGPHDSYVRKSFSPRPQWSSLTDLGFIVIQMDGMGTANRSKAFHDVCWQDLADSGFPDRILWHKAAAAKYPYYDISRVGIFGTCAGGQNSVAALLFHPEFYKVAVSASGCHDNRMDKASWNEQWMGYPVGPQYAKCSNIEHAGQLQGKLMLIEGELDRNVPVETTFQLIAALERAGKDYEFVFVPGGGHGPNNAYVQRRRIDFFVENLHGVKPPDRNAAE